MPECFLIPLSYSLFPYSITVVAVPEFVYSTNLGCKKVQGQSEATLQAGRCDQKV